MIIYRIIYPWGIATVFFFLFSLIEYKSIRKTKSKKKKGLIKQKTIALICCIILMLSSLSFSIYESLDLLLQDHVTYRGYYLKEYSSGFIWKLYFSENGEVKSVFSTHRYDEELVSGERYEYTYAKRTRILLEIHELSEK